MRSARTRAQGGSGAGQGAGGRLLREDAALRAGQGVEAPRALEQRRPREAAGALRVVGRRRDGGVMLVVADQRNRAFLYAEGYCDGC